MSRPHSVTVKTVGETPTLLEADGWFPHDRILEADDQDMLEEERRLFYVALTRAKDALYLTYLMTCPGNARRATTGEPEVLPEPDPPTAAPNPIDRHRTAEPVSIPSTCPDMKLHPLKRKRIIWTRNTNAMLGTMPDAALAKKLRVAIGTVLRQRQKLGIPASRPANSIHWTREMIATLGRIPDREFARTYGMNSLTVYKKRLDLGIRCYARKSKTWHYWTKKEIALLGTMPDGDVALKIGIHKSSVAWKRCKLKIPPFHQKRPKKLLTDWTLKEIAVLGKMTDAAAAAALDLAPTAVRKKRISLGIPPFGRPSAK